ncbi:MAG: nucleotide exchange factor GrpE [Candidatus Eremiobacteraeota bacterium]|nr:nucleotide exchange factor GrpE [Candidatus Eremiobacteraeota bacterium]
MDTEAQTTEEATSSADDAVAAAAPSDIEAKLAAAEALAEERYQELQYARAEIENARKRAAKSAEDRLGFARKALLVKYLPVLDNLRRAMAFEDGEGLRGGLNGTLKGFEALLSSEGIVPLETVGKPFDPHVAEAISTRESTEHEDDVVLEEAQRGYRLGEELLRPAMVVVAKKVSAD